MTGLPPPAPSSTPPPRVELPSHDQGLQLPVARPAGELVESRTTAPPRGYRSNLAVGLLPAALILFLVLSFVAIVWTVVAAGGAAG